MRWKKNWWGDKFYKGLTTWMATVGPGPGGIIVYGDTSGVYAVCYELLVGDHIWGLDCEDIKQIVPLNATASEDKQREIFAEIDAVARAMFKAGVSPSGPRSEAKTSDDPGGGS